MRAFLRNQRGSLHLGIVAVILAVVIVGFVGYRVATSNKDASTTTKATTTQQQPATTSTGSYTSTEDVAKDDDSLQTTDIDQQLDSSQLDSDINNLL